MLIKLEQDQIVIPEGYFKAGDVIRMNIEVLINEPTLTGYNGLVSSAECVDMLFPSEANKPDVT